MYVLKSKIPLVIPIEKSDWSGYLSSLINGVKNLIFSDVVYVILFIVVPVWELANVVNIVSVNLKPMYRYI